MGFRNILLTISCIIVAFCASLYFQNETEVETVNWDQYKNLQYNEDRSHSLEDFNQKITPYKLEAIIQEIYEKNHLLGEKTRVMEIGTGNGRVLMQLRKLFPEVEFYGINKEKTHTFYRRESYILTALKFEIFSKFEVDEVTLPYIVFQNLDFGTRIPYDENKFDVVFSQGTIAQIKYKFELLNEVMRILRPGGISFHTDVNGLTVYSKGLVLDVRDALAEFRKRDIDITAMEGGQTVRFRKKKGNVLFPVTPHQPIPENIESISQELRRPEMGYNINY